MTSKCAWCGVLIVVLGLALAKPAEAQLINGPGRPLRGADRSGNRGDSRGLGGRDRSNHSLFEKESDHGLCRLGSKAG